MKRPALALSLSCVMALFGACGVPENAGSRAVTTPPETITDSRALQPALTEVDMAPVLSQSITPDPATPNDPALSFSPAPAGKSLLDLKERPLRELSAEAQSFLDTRNGKWAVAVVVPSQGVLYTANGDELTPMASVVKVAIMLATMDRAMKEGRDLTEREIQLLRPMITQSDNDSATALWDELGGGAAVTAYVNSLGIFDFVPNPSEAWGASRASAKAVALLFAQLAFGNILDQPMKELALELLSSVVPSQRWGVAAGTSSDPPPGTVIGLKDGWYPARYASWVNSAGMLLPGDDRPSYAIAVLTRGSTSLEYGIATIEEVAQRVHTELHCDSKSGSN